ncbi:enoyl-CoA hydratase/isomerase family protein [Streptomyces sp. NPDC001315]|uniref:enoyl-CoA hydratase/isomerase family protein n=1 Tax=Streptomyces sp. NPDC001315 TaxID=3364562 RepID=UPI0036C4391F
MDFQHTIDRPHARNAIGPATMDRLDKALDAVVEAADTTDALVIKGAGDKAFVSGGDLKELAAIRTESAATDMALWMRGICDRIAAFPTPQAPALPAHDSAHTTARDAPAPRGQYAPRAVGRFRRGPEPGRRRPTARPRPGRRRPCAARG